MASTPAADDAGRLRRGSRPTRWSGAALAAALLVAPASVIAAEPPGVVAAQDRSYDGNRVAQVSVAANGLETAVDIGRIASANGGGGGLLGWALISATDNRRAVMTRRQQSRADALATPVRAALAGVDIQAMALATTRAALAAAPWLHVRDVQSVGAPVTAADRLVSVDYRYEMSPDFTQLRVTARVTLSGRRGGIAAPSYQRLVTGIGLLRARSFAPEENAARWSADDGRLAREALRDGLAQVQTLIPYALDLDQREAAALGGRSRPQAQAAGFYGTLIARDAADPEKLTLWSNGPIGIRPLP